MKNYSTKDIANMTDIAESTVRKYAKLLEGQGYVFNRSISGYRIFTKQDIEVFLEFKNSSKSDNSVEETAKNIASKYIVKPNTNKDNVSDDIQPRQGFKRDMLADLIKKVDVLTDMNEKQTKFNEELLKRLDQQQKYIDQRLEERDQKLIESLRQSQEERKALLQIASAHEEEQKHPSFWQRLFKK
jgi:DNA-binding transcriptional MerR regulator